ncbi:FkbM family methyltransferase, partial [Nostoc sp. NIES-2111]
RPRSTGWFETDFFGYKYRGEFTNYIDSEVYYFGSYERSHLEFLVHASRTIKQDRGRVVFADVGANVGQHALFMSAHVDEVLAFEPWGVARTRLENLININEVKNVRIFAVGLGSRDLELPYDAPLIEHGNLGWGTFNNATGDHLPVRNGDAFLEENYVPRPDLIKIDVEGFEREVLIGLNKTLVLQRPVMTVEFWRPEDFGSEANFRRALYPDHRLYALNEIPNGKYSLTPFIWGPADTLVIAPDELSL